VSLPSLPPQDLRSVGGVVEARGLARTGRPIHSGDARRGLEIAAEATLPEISLLSKMSVEPLPSTAVLRRMC
jgi:hypothetical protein